MKVHCYFLNGSDAQGCLIVFIHSFGKDNHTARLDSNSTTWEEFTLDYPISCYGQVLAFDIEAGGNVSDLAVMADISSKLKTPCPLVFQGKSIAIVNIMPRAGYSIFIGFMVTIITSVVITSIVFMLALILVVGLLLRRWNKSNIYHQEWTND